MFKKQPRQISKRRSLITRENPMSPISEQFRTIRTNIQYAAIDQDMQVIMTTSSGPAEGKTTINANLAETVGQQEEKVLLVDADMRKPSVHYMFYLANHTGLSNIITKQRDFADVVQSTSNEALDVLTCGPIPPNPSELLGSQTMKHFINEARALYDYIIIDTPPVLAVTDAQIVAGISDGVILVVDSGHTEKEDARKATELLKQSNAKMLGAVLNRQERKTSNYMYYYGG
ncbi:CpsD/CapB family tyrosine-protein kinase [Natribacillus halophilus]|uniref:non-specific protein-tyrosine kinase n=1 Tax=Natribacillus halophilus TaxID=549003 RepID=A0A1G8KFY9_9BACI|nr:CpsD/CapB family tyrosine-protein kinase [Natribacillus halophilus]SDI42327.1 capsular exopolysaccharide family [Natribacillus halophilus]